ncbi:membrane-binding protein [Marinoscillum sp.]|uniref:toxin-antitoxin system YwqK family antitoxin n=1 Tax=Marinoscillum sp. TaxID=2024838 RepID=UPI003BAB6A78
MFRLCTTISFILLALSATSQKTFVKKTYYDEEQTQLKEIITLQKSDSSLHGKYQSLYLNGSLAISGYYNHGTSDSTWVYYFENGRKKMEGSYNNGKQNGKWSYYFESGEPKANGVYHNDIRNGYWTYYFENGQEKSSGIYFKDIKEGIWNYFYEEGSLKAQAYFNSGVGAYKEFYPNGKLKTEGTNSHGQSEGQWTYYYESGEIEAQGAFKNGLREGPWTYYHKNGQVSAVGSFDKGDKTGVWKYYYPDGSVSSEGQMSKDQKDGFWKLYYQTGEVKGEGRYDQGSGEYIEYYASGKQKARGRLVDGQKEGEWVFFNEEGLEDGKATFKDGRGDYVGYYPNGVIKMQGTIEDNRRVGEWTLYNPDGSVAGTYRPVYEEQKPIFRTSEEVDLKEGKDKKDKPEYKYKNKKLRYFEPRINEYNGIIVGTNPAWTLLGRLPLAVEYYIQERMGFEAELTLLRNPFFTYDRKKINETKSIGSNIAIRQKFYHDDTRLGMFYFGHQILGGFSQHHAYVYDSITAFPATVERKLEASEKRIAYGLFIGNRWMQRVEDSGFTIDMNIGVAIGRRFFSKEFESVDQFDEHFSELNQDEIYLPIILTINIGFAGPKRRTVSF